MASILRPVSPDEISGHLNFHPRKDSPSFLPVIAVQGEEGLVAISGFDRLQSPQIEVLIVPGSPIETLSALWKSTALAPLENLRFQKVLGLKHNLDFLLELPLAFQNFLDDRQVPLKNLSPFKYLMDWSQELSEVFCRTEPTSNQVREIVDLLADLKLMKVDASKAIQAKDAEQWLGALKKLRYPMTVSRDQNCKDEVSFLPWPKGVSAKWERQGDRSQIVMTAKIASLQEWERFQKSLDQINLKESFPNQ